MHFYFLHTHTHTHTQRNPPANHTGFTRATAQAVSREEHHSTHYTGHKPANTVLQETKCSGYITGHQQKVTNMTSNALLTQQSSQGRMYFQNLFIF